MKKAIVLILAGLLFAGGCKELGVDSDSSSDGATITTEGEDPGTDGENPGTDEPGESGPLTKVYLSSLSNVGIGATVPAVYSKLNISRVGFLAAGVPGETDTTTDLLTVDASGGVGEVAQDGGEDLEPARIIPIEGAPKTVIVYQDASGDTEAYLIDQQDNAHQMDKIPVDQDGLKNSPVIIYSGGFHFLSADSVLNRAYFDAEGVLQVEDVQEDVIAFDFDSKGYLAYSTAEGVFYRAGGETVLLPGSQEKKLFFANSLSYGAFGDVGGISYWNSDLNAWCDRLWNPEMLRHEWQYSAYPASQIAVTAYTGERQDCEIQRLQGRNWLICGTRVYYFGGVNDILQIQDLSYAWIADFDQAKRALSDNYLYYGDSDRKLKRVDLIQQTATTISDQYLISTLTVSKDDILLFSGVTDTDERKFIQIDSDLTERELESAEVEQIQFLD